MQLEPPLVLRFLALFILSAALLFAASCIPRNPSPSPGKSMQAIVQENYREVASSPNGLTVYAHNAGKGWYALPDTPEARELVREVYLKLGVSPASFDRNAEDVYWLLEDKHQILFVETGDSNTYYQGAIGYFPDSGWPRGHKVLGARKDVCPGGTVGSCSHVTGWANVTTHEIKMK